VFDFMPLRGGYLIGNVSPARMDFRWFLVGNCIAILSSLVTPAQGHEWRIVTGFDPKNTSWSYHNGGSWPSERHGLHASQDIIFYGTTCPIVCGLSIMMVRLAGMLGSKQGKIRPGVLLAIRLLK